MVIKAERLEGLRVALLSLVGLVPPPGPEIEAAERLLVQATDLSIEDIYRMSSEGFAEAFGHYDAPFVRHALRVIFTHKARI